MKYIYRILYALLICPMFVINIPWKFIFSIFSSIVSLPILGIFVAYNYVVHGKSWEISYAESHSCSPAVVVANFYDDITFAIWDLPIVILDWLKIKGN